jgi:hypothetical protein
MHGAAASQGFSGEKAAFVGTGCSGRVEFCAVFMREVKQLPVGAAIGNRQRPRSRRGVAREASVTSGTGNAGRSKNKPASSARAEFVYGAEPMMGVRFS